MTFDEFYNDLKKAFPEILSKNEMAIKGLLNIAWAKGGAEAIKELKERMKI